MRKFCITIFLLSLFICGCSNSTISEACDAIEAGDTDKALELLESIDNYNQCVMEVSSTNPLYFLSRGYGVDTRTPLVSACAEHNYIVMEYLLENGADPNYGENCAVYPLEAYCESEVIENSDGVELLLNYGADPNLTKSAYPIDYVIRKMFNTDKESEDYKVYREQLIKLIEADSVVLDESRKLPNKYYSNTLLDLVKLEEYYTIKTLLEKGKLLTCINAQVENGFTPIMVAAEKGDIDTCSLLLEYGADTTIKNNKGQTVHHIASSSGHDNILELLNSE